MSTELDEKQPVGARKPIKSKASISQPTTAGNYDDLFGNPLSIDDDLKAEIASQNLDYRWVDAMELGSMGGYHKRGWRAYRRKNTTSGNIGTGDFMLGSSPDGTVRRGTIILAVRPLTVSAQHKAMLKNSAARKKGYKKEQAKELRQMVKNSGMQAEVDESTDDTE